ncbi:FliH/SctL family protein [Streptomyces sp. AC495_CC817]|uniref:FliH/SctL family protein n=1 Tax=Streptomyces sp. AC495_CC817 TaxID=2823900 RepID=UPI001C25A9BA|nr:FliH/SctL family protein [Streptomyces sp. AC495_CC817]
MTDTVFTPLVVPRVGAAPADVIGETQRARARGYADGFAEGLRAAREDAERQAIAADEREQRREAEHALRRERELRALEASSRALDERIAGLSGLGADRIEELAVSLAASILRVELSEPARSAAHALRRALDEMSVERWTRISLNAVDADRLLADPASAELLRDVEVVSSAEVDPGGAIVEIQDGAVDTRITRAMARAEATLRGDDIDGARP